ncbi:F0F1 ATP synthase subunit delta [Halobacillus litoralis]|uniref:F0F1 ATP synthase subunit delta n=1 Tax=Halobacillus litoralis TaxID=45668 RepID=UPI001CFD4F49|nr:F0F1 ATP synthase subunit delta [Halobacillus litoralis]WLR48925.1 F0F1 ATP synthase subunit delta [Halobacillus litoralis]
MSETVVAKRYAQALFQLAQERKKVEQIGEELRTVREVLRGNPSVYTFLKHPKITTEDKKRVFSNSFQGMTTEVLNTLNLIVDRHREDLIIDMISEFLTKIDNQKGIAEATVYSVRELSDDEKQQISKTFAPKVEKQSLNITNIIDSSLLGGIRVKIGNRIFDGSVSGKLHRMERELVSNKR